MTMTLKVGDPVLVWTGPLDMGVPVAARVLSEDDPPWLDICMIGQHLPQMYRPEEILPLDEETCRTYGLCVDCMGYGTTDDSVTLTLAPGVDQIANPCATCGGTGRPALRIRLDRSEDGVSVVQAEMQVQPHEAIRHGKIPHCIACGFPFEGLYSERGQHISVPPA